ncbi:MAG: ribonuclease HIII [Deltaproteobacteria bacterium]|jgi:ribonuclease HIII|nr:ribonuclease HIII [Deltaproteobacteria bacterium]
MNLSIPYVRSRRQAEDEIRSTLADQGPVDEIEINHGYGLKFSYQKGQGFSVIIYFKKSGLSSSLLCENAPKTVTEKLIELAEANSQGVKKVNGPLSFGTPPKAAPSLGFDIFSEALNLDEIKPQAKALNENSSDFKSSLWRLEKLRLKLTPFLRNFLDDSLALTFLAEKSRDLFKDFRALLVLFRYVFEALLISVIKEDQVRAERISPLKVESLTLNDGLMIMKIKTILSNSIKGSKLLEPFLKTAERLNFWAGHSESKTQEVYRDFEIESFERALEEIENLAALSLDILEALESKNSSFHLGNGDEVKSQVVYVSSSKFGGFEKPKPPLEIYSDLNNLPKIRIGVDESGKGDYFGPLVVAGVLITAETEKKLISIGVKDSKVLTDSANLETAKKIAKILGPQSYHVVELAPVRYNAMYKHFSNLNKLLAWGHAEVIERLLDFNSCQFVVADKFAKEEHLLSALQDRKVEIDVLQVSRGERDPAVAAASILARGEFLLGLERLGKDLGIKLLKGAGLNVDNLAQKIYQESGLETLARAAKLHFINTFKAGARDIPF